MTDPVHRRPWPAWRWYVAVVVVLLLLGLVDLLGLADPLSGR